MQLSQIIESLTSQAKPFKDIKEFSDKPGIYALFFCGNKFPFDMLQPAPNDIIYIGKTESSQQSRDADTHFATGKTGSSTLRRTFGAFLMDRLKLIPIPRGQSDIEKGRITHYKFDPDSETNLTDWMQDNLGLSFYPYDKTAAEINALETRLIQEIIPVLNIDNKNLSNPYAAMIRDMRMQTGLIAYKTVAKSTSIVQLPKAETKATNIKTGSFVFGETIHKYEDIWKQVSKEIITSIKDGVKREISLGSAAFKKVGNRKSYSFNLEFRNGMVSNNINGSAVARDLARSLELIPEFKVASKGKHIKLKMDSAFVLYISSDADFN